MSNNSNHIFYVFVKTKTYEISSAKTGNTNSGKMFCLFSHTVKPSLICNKIAPVAIHRVVTLTSMKSTECNATSVILLQVQTWFYTCHLQLVTKQVAR